MPMQWQVVTDGGYFANVPLSKKMREEASGEAILRQFATPIEGGLGKSRGEKIQFVRIENVVTAGGAISESDTMPVTKAPVSRGEVVATEYGNSVEYTGKLEQLSEFNTRNVFQRRLLDDQVGTIDLVIRDLLKTGGVVYTPTTDTAGSWTYNGNPGAQGADIKAYHLKQMRQGMREMKIRPYDSQGNYILVGGPGVITSLFEDSEWRDAAHYGDPDRIFNGEAGKLYGFRVIEENRTLLSPGMVGESTAGARGECYALGADAFVEAIVTPPELRAQNADYGRDKGLAWYGVLGYGLTWDNTSSATSWSEKASASGLARFIRVDGT